MAYWSLDRERGGFPVERATVGAFDLCVVYVAGEWQWLVRCEDRDIAEGAARAALAARRQAEAVAERLNAVVMPQGA